MKKYYWLSADDWKGPFHFQEILKMGLDDSTMIWYPELCENGKRTPEECTHEKEPLRIVRKALQKKICRHIIFSKTPLKGWYRYKNEFQIYPANFENLPQDIYAIDFPVVLEFRVDATKLHNIPKDLEYFDQLWGMSETTNETNQVKKLCNLLTAFTNHRFFPYVIEGKWAKPLDDDINTEELERKPSRWALTCFDYYRMSDDMKISKYYKPECDRIITKSNQIEYYMHNPFDDPKGEVCFPHNLTTIFDRYFDLQQRVHKIADASAYLICNGVDLLDRMRSLSFLSFISSIETIVNHEYTDKNKGIEFACAECKTIKSSPYECGTCGRPHWGIAAKFRNFLADYISPTPNSVKKYKRIYSLRSKIVHSGALLLNDSQMDWEQASVPNDHWTTLRETMQISRLTIVNWLIKKDAKFTPPPPTAPSTSPTS